MRRPFAFASYDFLIVLVRRNELYLDSSLTAGKKVGRTKREVVDGVHEIGCYMEVKPSTYIGARHAPSFAREGADHGSGVCVDRLMPGSIGTLWSCLSPTDVVMGEIDTRS